MRLTQPSLTGMRKSAIKDKQRPDSVPPRYEQEVRERMETTAMPPAPNPKETTPQGPAKKKRGRPRKPSPPPPPPGEPALVRHTIVWRPTGRRLLIDLPGVEKHLSDGLPDKEVFYQLARILPVSMSGIVAVDINPGDGLYTLWLAAVRRCRIVLVLAPSGPSLELVRANAKLNNLINVRFVAHELTRAESLNRFLVALPTLIRIGPNNIDAILDSLDAILMFCRPILVLPADLQQPTAEKLAEVGYRSWYHPGKCRHAIWRPAVVSATVDTQTQSINKTDDQASPNPPGRTELGDKEAKTPEKSADSSGQEAVNHLS